MRFSIPAIEISVNVDALRSRCPLAASDAAILVDVDAEVLVGSGELVDPTLVFDDVADVVVEDAVPVYTRTLEQKSTCL